MSIELHHLNTHGMMEQAGNVLDGVVRLKERIDELERMDTEHTVQIAKMNAYIRELEDAQRWRKVSEELPEDDKPYLVYLEGGFYDVDTCDVDTKVWRYRTTVTHWMPLPSAPKEGE